MVKSGHLGGGGVEHHATPSLGGHVASEGYFEGGMTFNRCGGVAFYREVMSKVAGFQGMENETVLEISEHHASGERKFQNESTWSLL